MSFKSRPLTCTGFSETLDRFGFSSDQPDELAHLAATLATERTTHPVFEAIVTHMDDCDHCLGIDDDLVAQAVEAEFSW